MAIEVPAVWVLPMPYGIAPAATSRLFFLKGHMLSKFCSAGKNWVAHCNMAASFQR